jgi:hypothetical protein
MWFDRSPQDVANLVSDMITWAESNPKFRAEPSPTPPLVLIEAWNEFGEGSHFLPTEGDGTNYGDALSQLLGARGERFPCNGHCTPSARSLSTEKLYDDHNREHPSVPTHTGYRSRNGCACPSGDVRGRAGGF